MVWIDDVEDSLHKTIETRFNILLLLRVQLRPLIMSSTLIGVLIGLAGGFVQSSGFILQKTGHNRTNKANEDLPKDDQKSVLSQWIWWLGIMVYTCGGIMNTAALNYAAQSIIASLGAVSLGYIAILSHFILKEKLKKKDVIAISVIAVGVVLVVVFGPSTDSDEELTIDTLRSYFQELPYILLVTILTVFTIAVFIGLQYEIKVNVKEIETVHNDPEKEDLHEITKKPNFMLFACVWISAFFASNNTLFIKSCVSLFASSVESSDNFKTNLSDPLSYVVVALWPTCMLSMEYFRQKALSLFGAIYVVPLFEVLCITLTSIIGMVYFEEYIGWKAVNVGIYCLGLVIVVSGVLVLSMDVGKIWTELYDDMIKTAFIDPDEIDYKSPKTIAFGGWTSEWFARREFKNRFFIFSDAVDQESKGIDKQLEDHIRVHVAVVSNTWDAGDSTKEPVDRETESINDPPPNTWVQCKQWVVDNQLSEIGSITLHRTKAVQKEYEASRALNEQKYVSYADSVKHRVFGLEVESVAVDHPSNSDLVVTKLRAIDDGESHVVLENNAFEYHLEDGIKHLIVFSTDPINKENVRTLIEHEYPDQEYLWWRNPPHRRSIPEIWHIQILVAMHA